MSIIVLLSDAPAPSRELAHQIALLTGYARYTQEDVLDMVAGKTGRPPQELAKCLQPMSFPWHKMLFKQRAKDRLLLEEELSGLICQNDFVYEGAMGFPLFLNISHALRVRLVGGAKASGETSGELAEQERKKLRKWALDEYRLDIDTSVLFDLTLNLDAMTITEAADVIQATLRQQRFRSMTYSLHTAQNLALSCKVRRMVSERLPDVQICSHNGTVYLFARALRKNRNNLATVVKNSVQHMDGVCHVEVYGEKKAFDAASCGQ